jgi:hypothetical protein
MYPSSLRPQFFQESGRLGRRSPPKTEDEGRWGGNSVLSCLATISFSLRDKRYIYTPCSAGSRPDLTACCSAR